MLGVEGRGGVRGPSVHSWPPTTQQLRPSISMTLNHQIILQTENILNKNRNVNCILEDLLDLVGITGSVPENWHQSRVATEPDIIISPQYKPEIGSGYYREWQVNYIFTTVKQWQMSNLCALYKLQGARSNKHLMDILSYKYTSLTSVM